MPASGEPLYLADDTEAVLEWQREQALLCPGCGLPRDETMNKEAQDAYKSHALRCHACAARSRAAEKFAAQKGSDGGLYFTTERLERSEPL